MATWSPNILMSHSVLPKPSVSLLCGPWSVLATSFFGIWYLIKHGLYLNSLLLPPHKCYHSSESHTCPSYHCAMNSYTSVGSASSFSQWSNLQNCSLVLTSKLQDFSLVCLVNLSTTDLQHFIFSHCLLYALDQLVCSVLSQTIILTFIQSQ